MRFVGTWMACVAFTTLCVIFLVDIMALQGSAIVLAAIVGGACSGALALYVDGKRKPR